MRFSEKKCQSVNAFLYHTDYQRIKQNNTIKSVNKSDTKCQRCVNNVDTKTRIADDGNFNNKSSGTTANNSPDTLITIRLTPLITIHKHLR